MYEDLINKVYNFYPAKKDGKWGVINKLNEVIIPFEYKTMELTSIGVIPIHRHNTTTFIRNPVRIFDMDWYYCEQKRYQ